MGQFEEWIEASAAPLAYGLLGLRPWELERLTPAEFSAMVLHAAADREEREDFLARIVAPLINAAGAGKIRKRVSQEELLGRPTQARRRATAKWKRERAPSGAAAEPAAEGN